MWLKNTTCNVNDIKRKVAGEKFKMSFGGGAASRTKVLQVWKVWREGTKKNKGAHVSNVVDGVDET